MSASEHQIPHQLELDGVTLQVRPLHRGDQQAVLRFAQRLPHHDLLFLRRDIRDPKAVEAWLGDIASGLITTLLALLPSGEIAGYGTLHRSSLRWSRHVAELRVLVSPEMRGKGLGRALGQDLFRMALAEDIEKLVAQMTLDQKGAIATFEGLGFRPEAVLRDQVKDLEGRAHDLLVMSHTVVEFGRALDAYGVPSALGVEEEGS